MHLRKSVTAEVIELRNPSGRIRNLAELSASAKLYTVLSLQRQSIFRPLAGLPN